MNFEEKATALICRMVSRYYMKRPELGDFLHTKFFTFSGIRAATRNEVAYRMGGLEVHEVKMAALELTNTCNLECNVCPVNNGMKRQKGFMGFEVFRRVLENNPGLEIIQLCLWGEPLMHPRLFDFIQCATERGIRTYLYTNGTLLDDEFSRGILYSGLHRIIFSIDGYGSVYERIRGHDYAGLEVKIFRFLRLREEMESEIRVGVAMVASDDTVECLAGFRDRWAGIVDEIQVTPHITHKATERRSRCRLLWLGYPIVLWDGRVVPCCVDYEGTLALGNVLSEPDLKEVWNGERAVSLRRDHLRMSFEGVCRCCNEYRSNDVVPRFDI
jgi:sulfatase maturation enzyme AslB (radical SAM superfamily)